MTENPSPDTLAGDAHVTSSDGVGTVQSPALRLDELNKLLGSDFKDTETALKALKDTKDFVGKRKEDIAAEVKAGLQQNASNNSALESKVQSLETAVFYANRPDLRGHEAIINAMGSNPARVVESEAFKTYFEKAKVADEVAQSKSVVSSNARISQSKSIVDEAVLVANARGTTMEDVATVMARAINEEGRNAQG